MWLFDHHAAGSQTGIKVNVPTTMTSEGALQLSDSAALLGSSGGRSVLLLRSVRLNQSALSSVILIMGA